MSTIEVLVIDNEKANVAQQLKPLEKYFPEGVSFLPSFVDSVGEAQDQLVDRKRFDAVFLDIGDVDPERDAILRIRSMHPYIPIVMLSKYKNSATILEYLDLGARTYIPKLDIPPEVLSETSAIRDDQEEKATAIVNRIMRTVDEYQSVKRFLSRSLESGTVRKSGSRHDLEHQLLFLEEIAKVEELARFFPPVISSEVMEHAAFYEMPFYEMRNLYKLLLSQEDEPGCEEVARKAISLVIEGPFLQLSRQRQVDVSSPEIIRPLFFERFEERVAVARQKLKAVGDAAEPEARDFLRLLDCRKITLGNLPLRGAKAILDEIEQDADLMRRLKPRFLAWTHGDLHFKNILLDDRLPRMMEIKLVDPRGTGVNGYPPGTRYPLGTGDPAYDIGKLLYSSRGMSHLIQDELFRPGRGSLVFNVNGEEAEVGEFKPVTSERSSVPEGLSRAQLSVIRPSVQCWIWSLFKRLGEHVRECVERTEYPRRDPDWWLRACLYEALHFCSLAPMRVEDDPDEAIHLFLRGTELMSQFITDYRQGRLNPVTTT